MRKGRCASNPVAMVTAAAILAVATACAGPTTVTPRDVEAERAAAPEFALDATDIVHPAELPALGKWMVDSDGTVAHWLDATYDGKHLREPINVILFDGGAEDAASAKQRLRAATTAAGYPSRRGHSGGYRGYVAGDFYDQLPAEENHAFSNRFYIFNNNHGRIFGPAPFADGYLFIGAFSRERVAPFDRLKHQYSSFERARDDFAQRLDQNSDFEIVGLANMDNALIDDPLVTTGDHDGHAVWLSLE